MHVNAVLKFLHDEFPDATICYLKIKPRHWWNARSRVLVRWIGYHVCVQLRNSYKAQEIWNRGIFTEHYQFGEQVLYGMLHTVMPVLTLKCILNKWKGKLDLTGLKRDQI